MCIIIAHKHGTANAIGLSPLARGTPMAAVAIVGYARFIPAGAGNTASSLPSVWPAPVYPRWRGEHIRQDAALGISIGLSPLARGTLSQPPAAQPTPRFIPAGAGNTGQKDAGRPAAAVYPRWRGEHSDEVIELDQQLGLSPLARGTQHLPLCRTPASRFIPAGAGNTAERGPTLWRQPVYPRWRGEHRARIHPG